MQHECRPLSSLHDECVIKTNQPGKIVPEEYTGIDPHSTAEVTLDRVDIAL